MSLVDPCFLGLKIWVATSSNSGLDQKRTFSENQTLSTNVCDSIDQSTIYFDNIQNFNSQNTFLEHVSSLKPHLIGDGKGLLVIRLATTIDFRSDSSHYQKN